ncbi:6-carboxytetrahydropterin synthase [Telmatocola sphagniphila]|uniref:6-carboxy-5,6,7,8-tetrahydropterin synthase n=1 Tax=Telmatocola sphagniphila TaxID=1123043 RepID=A0A8E6EV14_9BACT|nr:6-carboxytetrahydropterin synthase [Telmatocola sphagniphila]QVL32125.1 6-carboxytetrahydropterin synthase [Telmatocola sphagniphila]
MYRVARELEFCFGHRLPEYDGKCRNIHGHNAKAVITLEVEVLDKLGLGTDFVQIKRIVGTWLDQHLDHKLILNESDPYVAEFQKMGIPLVLLPVNPTTENMAKYIFDYAKLQGLPVAEVTLWETPYSYATYRPGN